MSEVAGTLIDVVLQRTRDPQGAANSRAFTMSMLSQAQRFVNAQRRAVLETTALTTEPYRLVYPIKALLPNSVKIEGVKVGDKDLVPTPWETLIYSEDGWWRAVGDSFETFTQIGRDLLVVHPALEVASSVDVVYTKLTNDLTSEGNATELDDSELPFVLDLTESLLLLRDRNYAALTQAAERLKSKLGAAVPR